MREIGLRAIVRYESRPMTKQMRYPVIAYLTQINWISPCRLDFLSGNELAHIFAHELMQLSPKGTKRSATV